MTAPAYRIVDKWSNGRFHMVEIGVALVQHLCRVLEMDARSDKCDAPTSEMMLRVFSEHLGAGEDEVST